VLGFDQRGRALQIVTFSEPGFDSKFSGNTTDICPVGALLTTDYHHSPRPWETKSVPSICPHCAVGCNLALATRVNHNYVARVMPRQNEQVNEIWICDKGRFGAHFVSRPDRIQRPLVRRDGQLVEATWDEALAAAADLLKAAGSAVGGIAGDRLSNEDLYLFQPSSARACSRSTSTSIPTWSAGPSWSPRSGWPAAAISATGSPTPPCW
jgi:NADH-quinone oxidoreductase subunit G